MGANYRCEDPDAIRVANNDVTFAFSDTLTQYKGLIGIMRENEESIGKGTSSAITVLEQMHKHADEAQENLVDLTISIERMNDRMEELSEQKINLN